MTASPTGALPMPRDGIRVLSPGDVRRRATAMTCQRTSYSECQGQIYVNLFFDGSVLNACRSKGGQKQRPRLPPSSRPRSENLKNAPRTSSGEEPFPERGAVGTEPQFRHSSTDGL